jgi:6-phosphofructokinase
MQEIRRRGLKVAVAGIPKTIDNDIPVCLLGVPYLLDFHYQI